MPAIARETATEVRNGCEHSRWRHPGYSTTEETATVTKSIEDADGFAQVFPEHKFHIVAVLQEHGQIAA